MVEQTILETRGEFMEHLECAAGDKVQLQMGKMILGARVCNDVVKVDLGLWGVRARKLMHWPVLFILGFR